ncbi:MAG: alpha/beta fold hydrolase, partial [Janthinobacterium lividum]
MKPSAVLVHGAFADSSSWADLITALQDHDLDVVAYANPLRGVQSDAAGPTALLRTLNGPVVLVGHSYGGAVLTAVPVDAADITGLVHVAAFALASGESAADASGSLPGSTLGETLHTVPLADGAVDASIEPRRYHAQF